MAGLDCQRGTQCIQQREAEDLAVDGQLQPPCLTHIPTAEL